MRRIKLRRAYTYLRYFTWYVPGMSRMPLSSNLDASLPLPNLKGVKVHWPNRYSYMPGFSKLEVIRQSFADIVPVILCEVEKDHTSWHDHGGFPVPDELDDHLGEPCFPKDHNDIRGEIFKIQVDDRIIDCAYDYSDYPVISADILKAVDIYFKSTAPPGPLPPKVVQVGYFANDTRFLAKARSLVLAKNRKRDIDVHGRFGSWTDSQKYREKIVSELKNSPLKYVGGFGQLRTYQAYLEELMRSKIAIDVPGQAPITYRLVEGMALGALIVCRKPQCSFPEEFVDGQHYVSFKDDASDIVQVCLEILKDDTRRKAIVNQAMGFYDRNFSPQSTVRRILRASLSSDRESIYSDDRGRT